MSGGSDLPVTSHLRADGAETGGTDQFKAMSADIGRGFAGRCDGVDGAEAFGWALKIDAPLERLAVEQWVDGVLAGAATANLLRGDLHAAGIGDGRCGWRMRLGLDPNKTRPQHVELRLSNGDLLPGGEFDITFDPSMLREVKEAPSAPVVDVAVADETAAREPATNANSVAGTCDGVEGDKARGWAWRPDFPEEHVEIEQWVDGVLAATTVADLSRPDLRSVGKGHGRYGWEMKLSLDAAREGAQQVEFRIKGGGVVSGGQFEFVYADIASASSATVEAGDAPSDAPGGPMGWYDGLKGSTLHGWAWNPSLPEEQLMMELWVDGVLTHEVLANGFRPDLRANGVGHGRYGWRLPVDLDPERKAPLKIEIRIKDGPAVGHGVFELRNDLSLDDPANAGLKPFVMSVLKPSATKASGVVPRPKTTMLVYCPPPIEQGKFWGREYDDYRGAMQAFIPVLATLGEVVEVASVEKANALCEERRPKGEECVLFSFGSPRQAPLDAACAVIPVLSWAFPTIPTGMWDGDRRSDWRYVLRTTGQAIVLSQFAADAVKTAMGADFPVVAIPAPVADRTAAASAPVMAKRTVSIAGVVFDSRDHVFDPNKTEAPAPVWSGAARQTVDVEGVLFAGVIDLNDGRRNWKDALSAFVVVHRDNADATLLLKLDEPYADWWLEMYKALARLPKFTCRVVAVRGRMDEGDWKALVDASHWYVNVTKAEGLCLPLQAFMSAGRPAVSPVHSALRDYVDEASSLIVASDEEAWTWPDDSENEGWSWTQHPMDVGPTTRHRVSWASLSAGLGEAYRIAKADPKRHAAMSAAARKTMLAFCDDAGTAAKLDAFLRLAIQPVTVSPASSELMAGSPK